SEDNMIHLKEGVVACFEDATYPTLEEWRDATGFDLNSKFADPVRSDEGPRWTIPVPPEFNLFFTEFPDREFAVGGLNDVRDDILGQTRGTHCTIAGAHDPRNRIKRFVSF